MTYEVMITSELSRIPQLSFDAICEAPHWGQRHKITSHAKEYMDSKP